MLKKLLLLTFIFSSFVIAGDVDDVNALIKKHWATQNNKDSKQIIKTLLQIIKTYLLYSSFQ